MPRVLRTVIPRIKKSIQERGLFVSCYRSVLLPIHLLREYREKRRIDPSSQGPSEFDQAYGVETDGDLEGWTYLSDLEIPSSNWIHGNNYAPIEPAGFRAILASLQLKFEDFVFVDFGSGKGRALLLALEFPFKKVVGIEFSPQLHAVALANLAKHRGFQRKCDSVESLCCDFLDFPLPSEPSVLFFFDPCDASVLEKMLAKISQSLQANPRELYVVYVGPTAAKERLLDTAACFRKLVRSGEQNFCVYCVYRAG
jgi:SAM-dependent methyltransferase